MVASTMSSASATSLISMPSVSASVLPALTFFRISASLADRDRSALSAVGVVVVVVVLVVAGSLDSHTKLNVSVPAKNPNRSR